MYHGKQGQEYKFFWKLIFTTTNSIPQIIQRISLWKITDKGQIEELGRIDKILKVKEYINQDGVDIQESYVKLCHAGLIFETKPFYPIIKELGAQHGLIDIQETHFTAPVSFATPYRQSGISAEATFELDSTDTVHPILYLDQPEPATILNDYGASLQIVPSQNEGFQRIDWSLLSATKQSFAEGKFELKHHTSQDFKVDGIINVQVNLDGDHGGTDFRFEFQIEDQISLGHTDICLASYPFYRHATNVYIGCCPTTNGFQGMQGTIHTLTFDPPDACFSC